MLQQGHHPRPGKGNSRYALAENLEWLAQDKDLKETVTDLRGLPSPRFDRTWLLIGHGKCEPVFHGRVAGEQIRKGRLGRGCRLCRLRGCKGRRGGHPGQHERDCTERGGQIPSRTSRNRFVERRMHGAKSIVDNGEGGTGLEDRTQHAKRSVAAGESVRG